MDLIPKKYFLVFLAALLVVALGYMAIKTSKVNNPATSGQNQQIELTPNPNESDSLESIERDVMGTDYSAINEGLEDIGKELDKN